MESRYIEIDLRGPGLDVSSHLDAAQRAVSEAGGGGWSFVHTPSDFRLVIYREFDSKKGFRDALAAIRLLAGGRAFVREIPAPP